MSTLSAREGYRLWAPQYDAETAVSYLENRVVEALGVPTTNCRLLDVGCGTGRRLRDTDAALAVGVDLSLEMLHVALSAGPHVALSAAKGGLPVPTTPLALRLAAADVRALPFAAQSFDVVWCRLMIGHVRELEVAYAELSRVCRTGGALIVSDLCAEAIAAGHRRTFRDAYGATHELEHVVHAPERQASSAREVGLELETDRNGVVGPDIRHFYADAGRLPAYEEQRGLPLVRALVFRKRAA